MRVNLKKAAALASALAACAVKVDHQYAVNIFADPLGPEFVVQSQETLQEQIEKSLEVSDTVFAIRQLIGEANEGEINTLLTRRALLEKRLAILNAVPTRDKPTNLVALNRQIEGMREGEQKPALGGRPLVYDVETATVLTPLVREAKREKRNVDDQLQMFNYRDTIQLPEEVVKVLTDFDLI